MTSINVYSALAEPLFLPELDIPDSTREALHEELLSTSQKTGQVGIDALKQLVDKFLEVCKERPSLCKRIAFCIETRIFELERLMLKKELTEIEQSIAETEQSKAQGDAAVQKLLALTGSAESLRCKMSTVRPPIEPPKEPLECAGLRNLASRCYAHSALKGLWSSKALRQVVEQKAKDPAAVPDVSHQTAVCLGALFRRLDETRSDQILDPSDTEIHHFFEELAKRHPEVLDGTQHDSGEFIEWIFDDLMNKDEALVSYTIAKERPEGLEEGFCIPALDFPEKGLTNIVPIHLPVDEHEVSLQQMIRGCFVQDPLDKAAILHSLRNAKIDPTELLAAVEKLPGELLVKQTLQFDRSPSCLIIQLIPSRKETPLPLDSKLKDLSPEEKKFVESTVPKRTEKLRPMVLLGDDLTVLCAHKDRSEGSEVPYVLKSVIIHHGVVGSGHYYAYLTSSVGGQVVRHNDSRVESVPCTQEIQADIMENGSILVYDRIDSAPPAPAAHDAPHEEAKAEAPQATDKKTDSTVKLTLRTQTSVLFDLSPTNPS